MVVGKKKSDQIAGEEGDVWDNGGFLPVKNWEIKLFGPAALPLSTGGKSKPRTTTNQQGNATTSHTVP